jgi:hypothetical protein
MASHDEDPVDELRAVGMTGGAALSRVAETMIRHAQDDRLRRTEQTRQATQEVKDRWEAQARVAERYFDKAARPEVMRDLPAREISAAWEASQTWAQVDRDRFGHHADAINATFVQAYGVDLREAADRLASREQAAELAQARVEREREGDQEPTPDLAGGEARNERRQDDERLAAAEPAAAGVEREQRETADYDTPQRREATAAAMNDNGVPGDAHEAKMTADRLNGQHPHKAAEAGHPTRARTQTRREAERPQRRNVARGR